MTLCRAINQPSLTQKRNRQVLSKVKDGSSGSVHVVILSFSSQSLLDRTCGMLDPGLAVIDSWRPWSQGAQATSWLCIVLSKPPNLCASLPDG